MDSELSERLVLAKKLKKDLNRVKNKEVVICPSFISLAKVAEILKGNGIVLGAQDVFWEESGAYTGEVSPLVLKDLNCRYVIVGHSERRAYLGETSEMVNKKAASCLEHGLTPIICLGETLQERQDGQTNNVVFHQLRQALAGIDLVSSEQLVVAYEPVWVIGRGEPALPQQVADAFELIHQTLVDHYPLTIVKNNVRLVYGGSVNSKNAAEFMNLDYLNGFLVGGASLDAKEFIALVKNI